VDRDLSPITFRIIGCFHPPRYVIISPRGSYGEVRLFRAENGGCCEAR
jgi:hypothetical protein